MKKDISNRVVVVGVDGATFDIIKPWSSAGFLPNIKKLLEDGTHGFLNSTIPPITGPAWVSFQTGKNPGKHGIFDWLKRDNNSYALKPINAGDIKHKTIWEIIGEQGKKACVINVPVTFPPKKVNGSIVSGMLTPSKNSEYTYPTNLKSEINKVLDDYEILPNKRYSSGDVDKWIEGLKDVIKKKKSWLWNLSREMIGIFLWFILFALI